MDVQMPELDGLEAIRILRQSEKASGAHMPVIALTAHAMKGDRDRCLAAGADDYVSKPIKTAELLKAIQGLASRVVPRREAPKAPRFGRDVVDVEAALERLEGDRDLLEQLAALFEVESGELLNSMEKAIERRDLDSIRTVAHTLKGSSANFGGQRISEALADLSASAKLADWPAVQKNFRVLKEETSRLNSGLQFHLRQTANPPAPEKVAR
jgi:response regulator RpfG family c-di-GMP phosphodiesterase